MEKETFIDHKKKFWKKGIWNNGKRVKWIEEEDSDNENFE